MDVTLILLCVITVVIYLMFFGVWYVYRDKPAKRMDGDVYTDGIVVRDITIPSGVDEALRLGYHLQRKYIIESFVFRLLKTGADVVVYNGVIYYKTAFGIEAAFDRENTLEATLRIVRYVHHRMCGKPSDLNDIVDGIREATEYIRDELPRYLTDYCIGVFAIGMTRIYDCFELSNSSKIPELARTPIATL